MEIPRFGAGGFMKVCAGCKKPFETDKRNARFGPPELCKCLERRAKHRAKRARERREYAKNPEFYRSRTRSRTQARKAVLALHGVVVKGKTIEFNENEGRLHLLGCNSPDCKKNFLEFYDKELKTRAEDGRSNRGAKKAATAALLKNLEAHHRDHDCFNNYLESYPERSNIELLCRTHHEHADRAKAGKAQLVLWTPPKISWLDFLLDLRRNNSRKFFSVSVFTLHAEWQAL